MNNTNTCSDCTGQLENGVIADYTHGGILISRYAKAEAPRTLQGIMGGMETTFDDPRRIIAKRCVSCNKLTFYAQDFIVTNNQSLNTASNNTIILIMSIVIFVMIVGFAISYLNIK